MNQAKYVVVVVVSGNPFKGYTSTTSFTSLKVVGTCNSKEEVKKW